MFAINPFTSREISTESRRYDDIQKTCILNLTVPTRNERRAPGPTKGLEERDDTISILFRDGHYKLVFDYMFKTGRAIPTDIVANLLSALIGYRLSFYSVDDSKLSTYVVLNRMKKDIVKLLVVPQGSHRIMLGSFRKGKVLKIAKDALVHKSRLIDEKYVLLMKRWNELNSTTDFVTHKFNPSFQGYVKNVATGRMVKEGS